jgi:hypothetical protein
LQQRTCGNELGVQVSVQDFSDLVSSSSAMQAFIVADLAAIDAAVNMSTTATSVIPSSLNSGYRSALQTTQNSAAHASTALATTASRVSQKVQGLATPQSSTPATPSSTPGRFRHPLTTEILRRNASSSITDVRVKSTATNAAALLLSFVFSDLYYNR